MIINIKPIHAVIALSIFSPMNAAAQQSIPDTLLHFDRPSKVIITENPNSTDFLISPIDGEGEQSISIAYIRDSKVKTKQQNRSNIFQIPYLSEECQSCRKGWSISMDGICLGLTNPLGQSGGGGIQWSKSFEICWLSCLNVNYQFSNSSISLGLGFDWRNYKTTLSDRCLNATEKGNVFWTKPENDINMRFSRLKVFCLQVPLLYRWSIPKSLLSMKLGGIACFNTHASLLNGFTDPNGNECECNISDINRRNFTADLFWSLTYDKAIGIYVRYSPMKVLKDPSPVNFNPLTVGIGFFI